MANDCCGCCDCACPNRARVAALEAERDRLRGLCEWGTAAPVGPKYDALQNALARVAALEQVILRAGLWRTAPCCLCGYRGAGYFQPETHPCAALDAAKEG